jgi:hypothetical protein
MALASMDRPEQALGGISVSCDKKGYVALFRASTRITLGDGNKALFWQDNWSSKGRLRDINSKLYKIASKKTGLVTKELENVNWITFVPYLNLVD